MESPFRCPGFPEVWCFDANTELDYSDPRKALGNPVCVPAHSNALRTFLRERPHLSSVWAGHYAVPGGPRPVSVWKMRGAASSQPAKIGEDDYQLIDHVFYDGMELFEAGAQALHLREHKRGDYHREQEVGAGAGRGRRDVTSTWVFSKRVPRRTLRSRPEGL